MKRQISLRRACVLLSLFCALSANAQPLDTLSLLSRADSLHAVGRQLYGAGYYENAIAVITDALEIRRETLGESHQNTANALNDIGACHLYLGDFEEAVAFLSSAMDIRRDVLGEKHPDFATCLNNLGICFMSLGDFEKGIDYYTKALTVYREVSGEKSPNCAQTYSNMCLCYQEMGDYENAIACGTKGFEIYREVYGMKHPYTLLSMGSLAGSYHCIGDYDRAIRLYLEAKEITREELGEKHPDYANCLNNLGMCYYDMKDYANAIACLSEAQQIWKELYGEDNSPYASVLINLGNSFDELEDYDKALSYYTEALELVRRYLGEEHPDYALILGNMGACYLDKDDYGQAMACLSQAIDLARNAYGEKHPIYGNSLFAMGLTCLYNGNYPESANYFCQYAVLNREAVLSAFSYLPGEARALYWNRYGKFFREQQPSYCRNLCQDTSFLRSAYDGALLSKGLLLNTETEIRKMILESGDEGLVSLYEQYVQERVQLENLYETPVEEREMDADSLAQVCEKLEQSLQKGCRAFGDYTRNLAVSWADVRDALDEGEIAIEFLEIDADTDSAGYAALTLKRDYESPHYVDLFESVDMAALKKKYANTGRAAELYGDEALYDLVWKPLSSELEGVETVYFGPSGDLYRTAIEYAFTGRGAFGDEKNVYRLSSTRQLALPQERGELRRSAVFGGLRYGMSESALLSDSRKYALREETRGVSFSEDSLDFRGAGVGAYGVSDLPGTEKEAELVAKLLRRSGMDVREMTGEAGTEASFKDLDGRGENMIHIATHGFYWEGDAQSSARTKEEASMTRSGLLFSGANNALKKGYVRQEGVEDGILTAQEIAQLDFRDADLVVLSACQTGLGEVSGEGVFGLQRGFKKAGVKTILMSLWEVDDEATQLLMTQFYKGLTKGLSKTDALKAAQAAVRANKRRDFSSPYYWAAFILLDGKE